MLDTNIVNTHVNELDNLSYLYSEVITQLEGNKCTYCMSFKNNPYVTGFGENVHSSHMHIQKFIKHDRKNRKI